MLGALGVDCKTQIRIGNRDGFEGDLFVVAISPSVKGFSKTLIELCNARIAGIKSFNIGLCNLGLLGVKE